MRKLYSLVEFKGNFVYFVEHDKTWFQSIIDKNQTFLDIYQQFRQQILTPPASDS